MNPTLSPTLNPVRAKYGNETVHKHHYRKFSIDLLFQTLSPVWKGDAWKNDAWGSDGYLSLSPTLNPVRFELTSF
jgi:hypothetical protein